MNEYEEGMNLYSQGEHEKAVKLFTKVLKQDPNQHKSLNALGLCLNKLGDLKQAEECFSKAILLAPHNEDYIQNLDSTRQKIAAAKSDIKKRRKRRIWIKKRTKKEQVNNTDVVCLFLGIALLGIYLVSFVPGIYIISPVRELLGIGGVLFCFFYVSTNFLKFLYQYKIPFRLIILIAVIIALLYLVVRFLLS